MRLFTRKSIFALAIFGLLGMMAALVWLSDPDVINAQSSSVFIVEGKVIVDGRPPPDGSSIIAYIDGRDVADSKIQGGTFVMAIPEQPSKPLSFKQIEFAGKGSDGRLFDFPQKSIWLPGGRATIALQLLTTSKILDNRRPAPVDTRDNPQFVVRGEVVIDGRHAPDGTRVVALVDGVRMGKNADVRGGEFILFLRQPDGANLEGQPVDFRAILKDGNRFRFPQTVHWQPDAQTFVSLEFHKLQPQIEPVPVEPSSPFGFPNISIPQLPDGLDIGCVIRVLGRIPTSPEDMSPQESFRVAQECLSGGSPDDSARLELERLQIEQEKQRLEQELAFQREQQRLESRRLKDERAFQEEQQRLEAERLKQERAFQLEQQRLDAQQRSREQERIKREQALQEEQDRLDRDRLKSERERQEEQARLDAERRKQDLERLKADQEMQQEQQRLDQRRALQGQQRQDELEKARFESERARIDRERQLEEERARLDQERLIRDDERRRLEEEINLRNRQGQGQGGQPPETFDPNQPPGGKVQSGPTRGFFTNTQVGGLGAANQLMDPTMIAVIGILVTMGATLMQMVKGS